MFTAAVSTIALILALGPQLQVSLQAAIDESQPALQDIEAAPAETPSTIADVLPEEAEIIEDAAANGGEIVRQPTPVLTPTVSDDVVTAMPEPVEAETSQPNEPAAASSGQVPETEWASVLERASAALTAASTATGNFIQSNADGSVTTGTFALNRPGRMRFDYDDPTPILIVSDGTTVAMEDSELETVDRVPIGSTPLGLILATDLNVNDDVEVLSINQNADRIGIRVSDSSGELDGTLTMVFDKASYDLLGWLTVDSNLQTTVVDLTEVETNVRVDPRLFRLTDAEDEEDER